MKKLILFLCLFLASPTIAAEHWVPASATLETGFSRSGSTITGTSVWGKRAYLADAGIIKGHHYKYVLTLANYSGTGTVAAYVTGIKMTCTGAWENSPNGYHGQFAIADNFNVNSALSTQAIDNRESDPNGSFRFNINMAKVVYLPDDPMVCPNLPGASHLHIFSCNTGVHAGTTYRSLRTTGGTSCGDPRYPVNRSAYWQPAMLDGAGHIVPVYKMLVYYKRVSATIPECKLPGPGVTYDFTTDSTKLGICIETPNGIKYITGYDMASGLHGPADPTAPDLVRWFCTHEFNTPKPGTSGLGYPSIEQVRTAGCTIGDYLYAAVTTQQCWDGTHLDSPNHRDHMSYQQTQLVVSNHDSDPVAPQTPGSSWGKCPTTHPYLIPGFSMQWVYRIDANFLAGHWRLSCDEQMTHSTEPGECLHQDYMEGWSQPIKDRWYGDTTTVAANGGIGTGCINGRNNGNFGSLCDGFKINFMGGTAADPPPPALQTPRTRVGWSRGFGANGTYTGELVAISSGELGLYGVGGFNGDVTLSITDVTNPGKGTGVNVTTPGMAMNDNAPQAMAGGY